MNVPVNTFNVYILSLSGFYSFYSRNEYEMLLQDFKIEKILKGFSVRIHQTKVSKSSEMKKLWTCMYKTIVNIIGSTGFHKKIMCAHIKVVM